jgi:hypothetical protein
MLHWAKALPVILAGQLHIATWLYTLHSALMPHMFRQGSTHLERTQALSRGQSELRTHSGRQPKYGSPEYSARHVHMPLLH